jgi:hypothetical protein
VAVAAEANARFHVGEAAQSGRVVLNLSFVVRDHLGLYQRQTSCKVCP